MRILALTVTVASLSLVPVAGAALPTPALLSPPDGATLASFGPALIWTNPPRTTQVHLQVVPFSNDGPGVDLLLGSPQATFQVPPPPQWYGLLPDMTYTWRIRASDAASPAGSDDPSWSPWASATFRTPAVSSVTISPVSPANGATVTTLTPTLQWADSQGDVFYYEVQVSRDPSFTTDPAATAPVYWELAHGGVSDPPNSYTVPATFPLQDNVPYYWRVRPRVQGDGKLVGWSFTHNFNPVTAAGRPAPTPTPTPLPRPLRAPRIAFTSDRDGNFEVYRMEADGRGAKNLTNEPGYDCCPAWSPDGERIAFVSRRDGDWEIYLMTADGKAQRNLSRYQGYDCCPVWSPDGAKIAFLTFRDGNFEIYVMNEDGSAQINLSNHPAQDESPIWSPDGTRIAFVSYRDNEEGEEIYMMERDGSDQTNLSDHLYASDTNPAWSPDGSKIAFASTREKKLEIYVMDADGTRKTRLTSTPALVLTPVWSPDGQRIAFLWSRNDNEEVYLVGADGSGLMNLTNHPARDRGPVWAPDGSRIAFVSDRDENWEIYAVNPESGSLQNLTMDPAQDQDPAWSPR